jgi:pantothenate synthetase
MLKGVKSNFTPLSGQLVSDVPFVPRMGILEALHSSLVGAGKEVNAGILVGVSLGNCWGIVDGAINSED